jgi:hypothetical protein
VLFSKDENGSHVVLSDRLPREDGDNPPTDDYESTVNKFIPTTQSIINEPISKKTKYK